MEGRKYDLGVDSIEFCCDIPSLFASGHYELQSDGSKVGAIQLHSIAENYDWSEPFRLDMGPIFDLRWQGKRLGATTADGGLFIFQLTEDIELEEQSSFSHDTPCLQLSWSNDASQILCTYGSGNARLFDLESGEESTCWKGHAHEAWSCDFDRASPAVLYTGADDCALRQWDTRIGFDTPLRSLTHDAGVCSIQSQFDSTLIATGSYDSRVRIYDSRSFRRPIHEQKLDGGCWRVKWSPHDASKLLVAAMRDGFHILDVNEEKISKFQHYGEHGNLTDDADLEILAYGCDWSRAEKGLIASGSFYDKEIHIWKADLGDS